MQFLRSIKSAKALGLATATIATMMAATVTPSQAQLTKRPGIIPRKDAVVEFIQKGFYLVDYTLTYKLNGAPKEFKPTNVPIGQRHRHVIPAAATDIHVKIEYIQGGGMFALIRRELLLSKTLPPPVGQTICFATFGTLRNEQVNNDCN